MTPPRHWAEAIISYICPIIIAEMDLYEYDVHETLMAGLARNDDILSMASVPTRRIGGLTYKILQTEGE